jgi:hypothetical protein
MDDRRLDRLEQALMLHGRTRAKAPQVPADFTAGVMRQVRQMDAARQDFWSVFSLAARRFAPVGALAATAACGYAQVMERLLNQAVLTLSLHGGSFALVGLMPR